jgi:nitroreductase
MGKKEVSMNVTDTIRWELGVGSCPVSVYEPEKARQILGFPNAYHLRIALSFGYPQDGEIMEKAPKKVGAEH